MGSIISQFLYLPFVNRRKIFDFVRPNPTQDIGAASQISSSGFNSMWANSSVPVSFVKVVRLLATRYQKALDEFGRPAQVATRAATYKNQKTCRGIVFVCGAVQGVRAIRR